MSNFAVSKNWCPASSVPAPPGMSTPLISPNLHGRRGVFSVDRQQHVVSGCSMMLSAFHPLGGGVLNKGLVPTALQVTGKAFCRPGGCSCPGLQGHGGQAEADGHWTAVCRCRRNPVPNVDVVTRDALLQPCQKLYMSGCAQMLGLTGLKCPADWLEDRQLPAKRGPGAQQKNALDHGSAR